MSAKPVKEDVSTTEEQSDWMMIWLLLGLLLVMLVGGGLALAFYFNIIPFDEITVKARQIPIVAKYFPDENAVEHPADFTGGEDITPENKGQQAFPPVSPLSPKPGESQEIDETLAKIKAEETKNISRLARLYGAMKPAEAAPIMGKLDDELVVSILRKMEDEQAAKILATLEPERAANLTRRLAANIPKLEGQVIR